MGGHRSAGQYARGRHRQAQPRNQRRIGRPKLKSQLADFGAVVMTGSPTDFRNFIAVEIDKSAKVITFVNIKAD